MGDARFIKYRNRGLSGLTNLGNTCFINTSLQLLSNTYELNEFLDNDGYMEKLKNIDDSLLLVEWDNLRRMMWRENSVISPGKFVKTVQKVAKCKNALLFTEYSQNDVPEFILFVINCFHDSLSREVSMNISGKSKTKDDAVAMQCYKMIQNIYSKDYSEMITMFYGIQISEIVSLETNATHSMKPESFFIINLPIPQNCKSLYDCFDLHIKGEILDGENAWFNEDSNLYQNVKKSISYWSFPNILVIDIKRFDNNSLKNNEIIYFPPNGLDLSKYAVGYKKDSYIYDLYGVCNHIGSFNGGHYTAFIKNANGIWYYYDDESITEVNDEANIITRYAYCFFYRKRL